MCSLARLLTLPAGPERTAALAAWVQGLYLEHPPVLVGGGAVELYSGGAYVTGDLDFVGEVPPVVAGRLEEAGFARKGGHWIHEAGQIFLEFPGGGLEGEERAVTLGVGEVTVEVIGPEETIVDRLAAWQHWRSEVDGINAFRVWQVRSAELDRRHLERLAAHRDVATSLALLSSFAERLAGRQPTIEELEEWAQRGSE